MRAGPEDPAPCCLLSSRAFDEADFPAIGICRSSLGSTPEAESEPPARCQDTWSHRDGTSADQSCGADQVLSHYRRGEVEYPLVEGYFDRAHNLAIPNSPTQACLRCRYEYTSVESCLSQNR